MSIDFNKLRTRRVIDILREKYPGTWTWDACGNRWTHEDGWSVAAYAESAPAYPGDDDTFVTTYRRTDTNELVRMW